MNKEIDPKLLEKLADDLVEMHEATGIELENWDNALRLVEVFYNVYPRIFIGAKK